MSGGYGEASTNVVSVPWMIGTDARSDVKRSRT